MFGSRYPFDWQTPIGYFVVWVNQTTACSVFVWLMISMTALYYGFCIFMGTFMEDYRQSLISIEDKMQAGVDNEKKLSHQAETEVKREIMAIIQFHTEALQLSLNISILDDYYYFIYVASFKRFAHQCSDTYSVVASVIFLLNTLAIATSLMQVTLVS